VKPSIRIGTQDPEKDISARSEERTPVLIKRMPKGEWLLPFWNRQRQKVLGNKAGPPLIEARVQEMNRCASITDA
jgi:hypothetical protein